MKLIIAFNSGFFLGFIACVASLFLGYFTGFAIHQIKRHLSHSKKRRHK